MKVKLASKHGFCFGVEDAIELAEKTAREAKPGRAVALGPVIHNRQVVEKLEQAGLEQSAELEKLEPGTTVLIRSHGARPETLAAAKQRGLKIVDATCVLVKRAQAVVQQLHDEGYRVVMIGDRNHPEVRGVIGYAPDVIVVDSEAELDEALPRRGKLGIVAQTTHTPEHVGRIVGAIVARPFREVKVVNTLCLEVIRRQEAAVALSKEVDVMFVLGGMHSANTQELARLCIAEGVPTYHLEAWDQFRPEMVKDRTTAGVTAGASTPEWIITEFVRGLEAFEPAGT
ncbi:MAG: 4-hydroxy-3-methylbut-2-enyl diphosphate reductase [Phycisphaerae bacterium]|nr:4-hydroxy-3-methylbut-2-enyl diphosphate reductase [Phycisphaerae bacterium]